MGGMVVLIAIEPRSYRQVIGQTIQALRPHVELVVLDPDTLGVGVTRLEPDLVFADRPDTFAWTRGRAHAKVRVGGVPSLRAAACQGVPGREEVGARGGGALRPALDRGLDRGALPHDEGPGQLLAPLLAFIHPTS